MSQVYAAFLRRPRSLADERCDPFWEFGAFGLSGCHRTNLLHPDGLLSDGARVVFLQGGKHEIRVVGLTPPIKVIKRSDGVHIRWDRTYRPVPFEDAPLLIDNQLRTDFNEILSFVRDVNRKTPCGKVASKFRARASPLDKALAQQIINVFDGKKFSVIGKYFDAISSKDLGWYKNATAHDWGGIGRRKAIFARLNQGASMNAVETPTELRIVPKRNC